MKDKEIKRKLAKLEALEHGGVDNWDNYDNALVEWRKESHVDECLEEAIEEIHEQLVDADVDEPAGHGCGYSINFDEEKMTEVLTSLLNKTTTTK